MPYKPIIKKLDYYRIYTATLPLSITGNDISLGYNTTNLKLTSNQLNTIQDIANTSIPTFAALNTNGAVNLYFTSANNYANGIGVYKRGNASDINGSILQFAELGYHNFFGWDGSSYGRGAFALANTSQNWSTTAHGSNYYIYVTPNDSTTNVLGLRITQDRQVYLPGNVGVGGSPSATYKLYVEGTSYFTSSVGIATAPNASYSLATGGDIRTYGNLGVSAPPNSTYKIATSGSGDFQGGTLANTAGALTLLPKAGFSLNLNLSTVGVVNIQSSNNTNDAKINSIDFSNTNYFSATPLAQISFRNTPTYTHGAGVLAFSTRDAAVGSLQERMRIDNLGYVGIGTASPNSKLQVNGSLSLGYVAKTADYTLTASDYTVECTANTFTITLPTAVGIAGRVYNIKNTGTGVITVDCNGTETIDGELTQVLDVQYDNLQIQSNGANWIIL